MLWTDLRILIVDTGRVWWRLLPMIMGVYLLGWLGTELTLRVAVIAGDINPWLALALFAFSFVCTLGAAIVILTLAGRELGIRQLLPEDEREIDDRDTSMTRLLVITLLPFLAIYAAFGQVSEAAYRFVTQQWIRYGFLSDQKTVLGALHDLATQHLPWLVALLVGIYVLRRVLDYLAERTGLRILGLVVVLIESFFMLMVIMGGIRVFQTFQAWLRDRAVMQWLAEIQDALARFFAIFRIDLPYLITQAWNFFRDQVWPVLVDVLAQPLLWLAVAAWSSAQGCSHWPSCGVKGSRTLRAFLARPPSPATARNEHSGAWDHHREVLAWLQPASKKPSLATSTTNTCRRCMPSDWCCGPGQSSWAPTSSSTTW